jgi:transcriptional regulator with XRE-family HTH domain
MAKALGISASYVNLLENNERSVSVSVLLRMFEVYGVDWRDIADEDGTSQLADLRAVMQDPLFHRDAPRSDRSCAPLWCIRPGWCNPFCGCIAPIRRPRISFCPSDRG